MKFSEFYLMCFTILVKFDIYFLGLPWEEVFGVKNITDNLIMSIALEKQMSKRVRYWLNYSGTRFLSTENWNNSISWRIFSWIFFSF